MKRFLSILLASLIVISLTACGETKTTQTYAVNHSVGTKTEAAEEVKDEDLLSGKYKVRIEIENYGDIIVELDADSAPISVTNFMNLVHENFYEGLTFHRIIEGFMMQGGQSKTKACKNIKGEFESNGVNNPIRHERGVISMARSNDPNSASSQFFICHQDSFYLDGQYAAFGHVIDGMDVVDKVCEEAIVIDHNGTVAPENQPVMKGIYDITEE